MGRDSFANSLDHAHFNHPPSPTQQHPNMRHAPPTDRNYWWHGCHLVMYRGLWKYTESISPSLFCASCFVSDLCHQLDCWLWQFSCRKATPPTTIIILSSHSVVARSSFHTYCGKLHQFRGSNFSHSFIWNLVGEREHLGRKRQHNIHTHTTCNISSSPST